MPKKIIGFVEDDDIIRANYQDLLESDGYHVITYSSCQDALNGLSESIVDLALLDISLGDEVDGGLKICKFLRNRYPSLPIIFFTSHDTLDFQSKGWRFGVDDYVTKDTAIELVLLRIRALLKRYETIKNSAPAYNAIEDSTTTLKIDDENLSATWKAQKLDISLTQFWILKEIFENNGKAVDHRKLQKAAKIIVEPNTIAAHIKTIRRAFNEIDNDVNCIGTERGRGYRWIGQAMNSV